MPQPDSRASDSCQREGSGRESAGDASGQVVEHRAQLRDGSLHQPLVGHHQHLAGMAARLDLATAFEMAEEGQDMAQEPGSRTRDRCQDRQAVLSEHRPHDVFDGKNFPKAAQL